MGFNSRDRHYDRVVESEAEREARKRERECAFQRRREKEAERKIKSEIRVCPSDLDVIVGESNNNNSHNNNVAKKDEDWKPKHTNKNKVGKKTGQSVFIPPDLLAKTVSLATLCHLSTGQHAMMVAGILNILGCDLDKFTVSHSSSVRLRLLVNSKVAQEVKYIKLVRSFGARIFIHYDGKLMEMLLRFLVKRKKNDRVGILACSPDLPDDSKVQLLGIPELANGTGNYFL